MNEKDTEVKTNDDYEEEESFEDSSSSSSNSDKLDFDVI